MNPYPQSYKGHKIDPYRICAIYGITHPAAQHAIKKCLRAGSGHKTLEQDIDEAIASLQRWKEMAVEDKSEITITATSSITISNPSGQHNWNCVCVDCCKTQGMPL